MAWPPPALAINRTNATPSQDTHPQDHNLVNQAVNDIVSHVTANEQGVNNAFAAMIAGNQTDPAARFRMYTQSVAATTDAGGAILISIPPGTFSLDPLFAFAEDFYVGPAPGQVSAWTDYKIDGSVFTATSVRVMVARRVTNALVTNTPLGFRFVAFGRWN